VQFQIFSLEPQFIAHGAYVPTDRNLATTHRISGKRAKGGRQSNRDVGIAELHVREPNVVDQEIPLIRIRTNAQLPGE